MDILTEIIETSDNIVCLLDEDGFFDEYTLIYPSDLRVALQIKMQRKWEQENEMHLSDSEFLDVLNDLITESVSEGLSELVNTGHVQLSINPDGELLYCKTDKPFDI